LASCTYVFLTELAPLPSSTFAGAVPGGQLLPLLAIAQLAVATVAQGLKARAIRLEESLPVGAPERLSVLSYGLIVLIGVLGMWRGPRSGLLISGYDDLLAAILTSATVSLLLHVLEPRSTTNRDRLQEPSPVASGHGHQATRWSEAFAAATLAVACMITEISA